MTSLRTLKEVKRMTEITCEGGAVGIPVPSLAEFLRELRDKFRSSR